MVPNGSAYSNFPSFANNGTKTPPGGSTESAKYALGMVPADTFPAEWANYLFHGATAGITRLNADTGSIKKEINTVLSNFNITPDATLNNQLLEALTKLKAEAALAAHPVGSLYWTSVNENPAVTFGGGTWVQIKDRFILAAGDTYANGATGGSATVTLTTDQIPSHIHSGTTYDGGVDHSHGFSGTTENAGNHTHSIWITGAGSTYKDWSVAGYQRLSNNGLVTDPIEYNGNHTHSFSGTTGGASSYLHKHDFTTGSAGGGQDHDNMPPYIVKFCWERVS